jgi:LysM repeat protein
MDKRTILLVVGAVFTAVMIYISVDMLSSTTPPWKKKKPKIETELTDLGQDRSLFPDTTVFVYKVQKNEAMTSIAEKFNCKVDSIRLWNELATDNLKLNQSILIKIRALHRVEKNEFLEKIAQKYSTTVKAIMKANGIGKNATIRPQQELIIPKSN